MKFVFLIIIFAAVYGSVVVLTLDKTAVARDEIDVQELLALIAGVPAGFQLVREDAGLRDVGHGTVQAPQASRLYVDANGNRIGVMVTATGSDLGYGPTLPAGDVTCAAPWRDVTECDWRDRQPFDDVSPPVSGLGAARSTLRQASNGAGVHNDAFYRAGILVQTTLESSDAALIDGRDDLLQSISSAVRDLLDEHGVESN